MRMVCSPFAGGTNRWYFRFGSDVPVNQSVVPVLSNNFRCLGSEPNLLDLTCRFGEAKRQTQNPCGNPNAAVSCVGMFIHVSMHS